MAIVATNNITVSNVNDGTITHTAYAYSADGADRFTTVYPNLNLIQYGKFAKPITKWSVDGTTISKDDITGYFKVNFNGAGSMNRTYYGGGLYTIPIGQKYSVYIKAYSLESSLNIKIGSANTSQDVTVTNNDNIPKTYKVEGLVRGTFEAISIFGGLTTTIGTLFVSEIKVEQGSVSTPWMPSSSEVKTSDYPSYIGTYSDTNVDGSTDHSKYTWAVFKGSDGIAGQPGANAPTITNVQDQIYLSTSNTVQSGGSWGILIPAWSSGKYYWSRVATTFDNGTTAYSTPVLDEALNQAATNQIKVTQLTQDLDGFKTTVSNTYLSKSDASGTYADKVSVTSQINQSATQVTQNIQSWTNGQLNSYSTIQSTDSSIASAVADKADKSQITQLSDSINLKVSKGDVISSINQEAGQIVFNANKLVLNANTTEMTGNAFIGGDMIVDGSIKAEKLEVANLSALSSNIGSIQNDFTLEDGTTGTLHIGSSEYRIDSQVLLYDYLFKENIFFNPDGLSFSFDGDTASNSGYGNYRKSGSDFYLQNKQKASYTVSGISISNEFAGYSIQIGDADSKMSFVSENGQGFDFTGQVSFNGIPVSNSSYKSVALFYGITVVFRRQGNLVIASIARQALTTSTTGEDIMTNEKVPLGYRPSYSHYFGINRNSGTNILKDLVMGFASNGDVRVTVGESGTAIFTGSTSYFTTDPLP